MVCVDQTLRPPLFEALPCSVFCVGGCKLCHYMEFTDFFFFCSPLRSSASTGTAQIIKFNSKSSLNGLFGKSLSFLVVNSCGFTVYLNFQSGQISEITRAIASMRPKEIQPGFNIFAVNLLKSGQKYP